MSSRSAGSNARRLRAIGAGVAATIAASLVALGGSASAWGTAVPCTTRSEAKVFSLWNDDRSYFRAPDGGFESPLSEWRLGNGAAIVSDNQPWKLAANDSRALQLGPNATAEGRTMCTGAGEEYARFFVRDPGVINARLRIDVTVRSRYTGLSITMTSYEWSQGVAGWRVAEPVWVPDMRFDNQYQEVTMVIVNDSPYASGTWKVDDVYVDPFKSY